MPESASQRHRTATVSKYIGAIFPIVYFFFFAIRYFTAPVFSLVPPPGPNRVVVFSYIPAVQDAALTAYMPLVHMTSQFRIYPDGKTLAEMRRLLAQRFDADK